MVQLNHLLLSLHGDGKQWEAGTAVSSHHRARPLLRRSSVGDSPLLCRRAGGKSVLASVPSGHRPLCHSLAPGGYYRSIRNLAHPRRQAQLWRPIASIPFSIRMLHIDAFPHDGEESPMAESFPGSWRCDEPRPRVEKQWLHPRKPISPIGGPMPTLRG